jgi:hypothetical protein
MRLNDDDCVICRDWPDVIRPATLRANAMRIAVDSLPLKKAEHRSLLEQLLRQEKTP